MIGAEDLNWVEPDDDSAMQDAMYRALTKGAGMKVVTVEIVTNFKTDVSAEAFVLDMLEKERSRVDAGLLTGWQVTGVADHYSEQAKAYSP